MVLKTLYDTEVQTSAGRTWRVIKLFQGGCLKISLIVHTLMRWPFYKVQNTYIHARNSLTGNIVPSLLPIFDFQKLERRFEEVKDTLFPGGESRDWNQTYTGASHKTRFIPFIKNKVINYCDLFGIFRLSFLVNIQNIKFEKMAKISQRFHANL